MKYVLKKLHLTGQAAAIRNYGDSFWEWLCDEFVDSFTVAQATQFPEFKHLSPRTKSDYTRVILRNVEAQEHEKAPFTRKAHLYIWQ